MTRKRYWLAREPTEELYRDLIEFVAAKSDRATLVLRNAFKSHEACIAFLQSVEQHLVESKDQREWPGTRLIGSTARVYHYRVAPELVAAIEQGVQGLYDWIEPDRPEDLAFHRRDGSVALGTVAHERFAFVEMSDVELQEFKRALSNVQFEGD